MHFRTSLFSRIGPTELLLLLFFPYFHYPLAQPDRRFGHKSFHVLFDVIQQIRYGKMLGTFFQTFFALHTHGCHCWLFRYQSAVLEKIHHFCGFILESILGIITLKTAWNIHADRAGHAILSSCASDRHHPSKFSRRFLDQFIRYFPLLVYV